MLNFCSGNECRLLYDVRGRELYTGTEYKVGFFRRESFDRQGKHNTRTHTQVNVGSTQSSLQHIIKRYFRETAAIYDETTLLLFIIIMYFLFRYNYCLSTRFRKYLKFISHNVTRMLIAFGKTLTVAHTTSRHIL